MPSKKTVKDDKKSKKTSSKSKVADKQTSKPKKKSLAKTKKTSTSSSKSVAKKNSSVTNSKKKTSSNAKPKTTKKQVTSKEKKTPSKKASSSTPKKVERNIQKDKKKQGSGFIFQILIGVLAVAILAVLIWLGYRHQEENAPVGEYLFYTEIVEDQGASSSEYKLQFKIYDSESEKNKKISDEFSIDKSVNINPDYKDGFVYFARNTEDGKFIIERADFDNISEPKNSYTAQNTMCGSLRIDYKKDVAVAFLGVQDTDGEIDSGDGNQIPKMKYLITKIDLETGQASNLLEIDEYKSLYVGQIDTKNNIVFVHDDSAEDSPINVIDMESGEIVAEYSNSSLFSYGDESDNVYYVADDNRTFYRLNIQKDEQEEIVKFDEMQIKEEESDSKEGQMQSQEQFSNTDVSENENEALITRINYDYFDKTSKANNTDFYLVSIKDKSFSKLLAEQDLGVAQMFYNFNLDRGFVIERSNIGDNEYNYYWYEKGDKKADRMEIDKEWIVYGWVKGE